MPAAAACERAPGALRAGPARPGERALLALVQLAVLVPFLSRPIHLDETFFLAIAEQIARAPLAPYAFDYNWTGSASSVWAEMQNPPLVFYLHAALLRAGVESVLALHALFALFALAASQLFHALAQRLTPQPLVASLLLVVCPAYWVSATTLMVDMPLLAAMLAALLSMHRALEPGRSDAQRWVAALLAGGAAAVAILTKYFALGLPLLLLAQVALARRAGLRWRGDGARALCAVALPLLAFVAWGVWSDWHVRNAFAYRAAERADLARTLAHALATASYSGGLLVFPAAELVAALRDGRRRRALGLLALAAGVLALPLRWALFPLPPDPLNDALLLVFVSAGVFMALASLCLVPRPGPGAGAALLRVAQLWLAGGLVFAAFFNWTVNARTVLLFAPPAVLLFAVRSAQRPVLRGAGLLATAVVGALVCAADAELAAFGPALARQSAQAAPGARSSEGGRVRFVGHWGLQHAMERAGFAHLDLAHPGLRPGDVVITPRLHRRTNAPLDALPPPRSVEQRAWPRRIPIAVMSEDVGAGLHGSFLGPWPWAFTRSPLERVEWWRW